MNRIMKPFNKTRNHFFQTRNYTNCYFIDIILINKIMPFIKVQPIDEWPECHAPPTSKKIISEVRLSVLV